MVLVGPTNINLTTDEDFVKLGDDAVPILIDIFKNPTDASGFTVNQSILTLAFIAFAKEGNKISIDFIKLIAKGEFRYIGVDGKNARKLAKSYLSENIPASKRKNWLKKFIKTR